MHDVTTFMSSMPSWVTPAIIIAAVVVLGVIAAVIIRFQTPARPKSIPMESVEAPDPHMILKEVEDTHARAAELIAIVHRWSSRLDDKEKKLDQLLIQTEKHLRRLQACEPKAAARPPAQKVRPPVVAIEPKLVRPADRDPLSSAVYRLADSGRAPLDIARELDEQVGKVELILALREANSAIA